MVLLGFSGTYDRKSHKMVLHEAAPELCYILGFVKKAKCCVKAMFMIRQFFVTMIVTILEDLRRRGAHRRAEGGRSLEPPTEPPRARNDDVLELIGRGSVGDERQDPVCVSGGASPRRRQ